MCWILEVYLEIRARQGTALGGREESATALAPPAVNLEDLETLAARFPAIRNPGARPITAMSDLTYPPARCERSVRRRRLIALKAALNERRARRDISAETNLRRTK